MLSFRNADYPNLHEFENGIFLTRQQKLIQRSIFTLKLSKTKVTTIGSSCGKSGECVRTMLFNLVQLRSLRHLVYTKHFDCNCQKTILNIQALE